MLLPQDYQSWHRCITVDCGINIDEQFLNERIATLTDKQNSYTSGFIALYGEAHYQNVLDWFKMARQQQK